MYLFLLLFCLIFGQVSSEKYEWKGCGRRCQLGGFEETPLVLLSLDGFARDYLDRKIVRSFDYMAECGVKAERVYPSYPSKTFPNHYTIVTGLYPESHGITDNDVYDPEFSPKLERMRNLTNGRYYAGEPIWSMYQRTRNKPAHSFFWVGSDTKIPNVQSPRVYKIYNTSVPWVERVEAIIGWLELPKPERPGLITAYIPEPDGTGHYQRSKQDVDKKLGEVDDTLDYLFQKLHSHKLLDCINLVILSDHGMKLIDKRVDLSQYVNQEKDDLVILYGVNGRIHKRLNSDASIDRIKEQLTCKIDEVEVYSKEDVPTRKHHSRNPRIGDILLEGSPGVYFEPNANFNYNRTGDHGYDYLSESMHTIFFARGPDLESGVTVAPFQNVQYMNLWIDLLRIPKAEKLKNNGTDGFFDNILRRKQVRSNLKNNMRDCSSHTVLSLPLFSTNTCYDSKNGKIANNRRVQFKVLKSAEDDYIDFANFPEYFKKKVYTPLKNLTQQYIKDNKKLYVITGTTVDQNYDGIFDTTVKNVNPTHFFRILLTCAGSWLSDSPPFCDSFEKLRILSFIFPIIDTPNTWECMTSQELLLEYTATISDIERITNLQFQIDHFSYRQNLMLRQNITLTLW